MLLQGQGRRGHCLSIWIWQDGRIWWLWREWFCWHDGEERVERMLKRMGGWKREVESAGTAAGKGNKEMGQQQIRRMWARRGTVLFWRQETIQHIRTLMEPLTWRGRNEWSRETLETIAWQNVLSSERGKTSSMQRNGLSSTDGRRDCSIPGSECEWQSFSRARLLATAWMARQAPLSMEFSREEYWGGLPFPSPQ